MNTPNPYASPNTDSTTVGSSTTPRRPRFQIRTYLVPTFIGAVIGSVVLAPFCRGPGDPNGHSIAAGIGGFVGLIVGIVKHTFTRWKCADE